MARSMKWASRFRGAGWVGLVLLGARAVLGAGVAEIISFSPEGTIKDVRQVRATFSEPLVAFGDPRAANGPQGDPFDIQCSVAGKGRWGDARNWLYDFEKDLPGGVRCSFRIKDGLKALSGNPVAGAGGRTEFAFDTGGPAIKRSEPWEGSQIDEEQIFILSLDAEADPKTVEQNVYFSVKGINEKIPVRVLDADPREEFEAAGKAKGVGAKVRLWARKFGAPNHLGTRRTGVSRVIVQARRRFAPDAEVMLVWGSGVATPGGAITKADQVLPFQVRPRFAVEFNCERENAASACIPIAGMWLNFNADVPWSEIRKIRLRALGPVHGGTREWKPFVEKNENRQDEEGVRQVTFKGPFPGKSRFEIVLPSELKDDAGRALSNAERFPLQVATSDDPPLIKFPADFGVIELKPEAILPVTVRNVEPQLKAAMGIVAAESSAKSSGVSAGESVEGKLLRLDGVGFSRAVEWLTRVSLANREEPVLGRASTSGLRTEPLSIRKPNGSSAFEVIGIPLKRPGFYVVEFESPRLGAALLGKKAPMYVPTAALVTNLSVHFKQGRESSLVWVTTLDQARPVEGAAVAIRDCAGALIASGRTDSRGIANIEKALQGSPAASCTKDRGYSQYSRGYYVVAEKDDDFSFVHTSWAKGIESWRYNLPGGYELSPEYASTVFDRTLLRAGETVHMKHFFRKHTRGGIEIPSGDRLPRSVRIRHQESNQSYDLALNWRAGGVAESTWSIPKGAKLGTYTVTLRKGEAGKSTAEPEESEPGEEGEGEHYGRYGGANGADSWEAGSFRVEEYRVPLMKGQIRPPSEDLVGAREARFDVSVEYLAGGAAAKLPVAVRYQTSIASPIEFPEFDGYAFGTGKVRDPQGDEAPLAPGEVELDLDARTPEATSGPEGVSPAVKNSLTLDAAGTGHFKVPLSDKRTDQLKRLHVEIDYRDPSGETQTVARNVPLFPSARLIGVKPNSWFASKKSLRFQVAVTDLRGKAVRNAPVEVEFVEQKHYSHRKRLVGGFYAYENRAELKRHGKACGGVTDEKGFLDCDVVPPVSGNLILEARTSDEAGRRAWGQSSTWIYDSEEWWFAQDDSDRIDLLPERKRYETGEKAVFQVRMPFREATALVTVEREGVIDSFVVSLSGKKPLIEVPIKPNYAPNVFVSALVVRGRAGEIAPGPIVDLGRPAYKLGISEIHVGWKPHELAVHVQPSKEIYQVREKGRFTIQVKTADGSPLPQGSEVALAAVDEGLLQLKPNGSWKLLESMMRKRGYEVQTYTLQSEVVGKRHFGLKSLPPGGDGSKAPSRELFDTLLYWNGKVALDSNGEAEIQFPMNDSITGFRVVAVAHAGAALFGTGAATIRTTQDLMILPGIPPLAREGDRMNLEFTLRNTTSRPMIVSLQGKAAGVPDFAPADLTLAPNEAQQVRWALEIPSGVSSLKYQLSARAGSASDRIQFTQKVVPAVPVRTLQATLAQLDGNFRLPVEMPAGAVPGRGGLRVALDPTLTSSLEGVREYMGFYPYTCLEQRASRAVALRNRKLWQSVVDDLPSYLDPDGLAKYFPSDWIRGSEILTAYLVSLSNEAGWELPESLRARMLAGLKGFVEGRIVRISDLPTADLTVRKVAALEALSRYGEATWAMTGSLQLQPNLWPTSAVIDWREILKRLKDAPVGGGVAGPVASLAFEARRKETDQILRSRLNFQGSMMGFSTENVDELWWMMVSTSTNANRFVLSMVDDPAWKEDIGRVIRGALHRQRRGHWGTTTANAWGVLAVEKFVRLHEKAPVAGTTQSSVPGQPVFALNWSIAPKGKAFEFAWPPAKAELSVTHSGSGKPWLTVQSLAAVPLKEALSTGYRVKKTVSPFEQKIPGKWSKGDIARIRLELESQSDMTWVVVNDPIPAGSSILGSGLGNDSGIATTGEKARGWAEPAFQERAFDGFRAYYQYVPKGSWSIEYTVRFNQAGQLQLPPTRVEAMYAPEMFGELPNAGVTVAE